MGTPAVWAKQNNAVTLAYLSDHPHFLYKSEMVTERYGTHESRERAPIYDANIISSEIGEGLHTPILDIDIHAALIQSSTKGHYHLYIDSPLTWRKYKRLLRALKRAGIIEPGYYKASVYRKATDLRLPWVRK